MQPEKSNGIRRFRAWIEQFRSVPPRPILQAEPSGEPCDVVGHLQKRPSEYDLLAKARKVSLDELPALEAKAQSGDPEAETVLALAYHSGALLRNDEAEALRLLHKAADGGYVAAQESLGIFYAQGIGMQHPDPEQALVWYGAAARQGSIDAATNIGSMYAMGDGVPKDMSAALRWFRQAAEAGGAAAQYNLSLIYAHGDGVQRDERQSLSWLTKAADQGSIPALLELANRSANPRDGTRPDVDTAIARYKKAAELGDPLAPSDPWGHLLQRHLGQG